MSTTIMTISQMKDELKALVKANYTLAEINRIEEIARELIVRKHNGEDKVSLDVAAKALEAERKCNYRTALVHWLDVGYSADTARALAAVKWGQSDDVKKWALWRMTELTNLREEDMI
jgi:hypothetical protein